MFCSELVSLSIHDMSISTHQQTRFFCMYHFLLISNIPAFSFWNFPYKNQHQNPRFYNIGVFFSWGDLGFLWFRCTCRLWIFEKLLLRAACEVSDQVGFVGMAWNLREAYQYLLDPQQFNSSKWRFWLGSSSGHCYWEGHNQHTGYQGTFERWCSNKHSQGIS